MSEQLPGTTRDLPRRIGFFGAVAVMVGIIIGSGIFQTPPVAAANLGSPWLILGLWAAGGVLALFGALTYAELTTRYPRSGGLYIFLREGFGRAGRPMAFTFGWTYMLITKPFAAAGIMVPGAEHLLRLCGMQTGDANFEFIKLSLTTVLLIVFTAVNVPGVKTGTRLAMVLTTLKFGALAVIVLGAVALMKGSGENFKSVPRDVSMLTALAAVMAAIMWTYDGWADVGSIAGEVQRPRRTLPLIFITGTLATMGIYLAVNAVFMWMMPLNEMAKTETVAPAVATLLVGEAGGIAVTAVAALAMLGSSHASIITGARVTFAQARDGLLFRSLGKIHPKHQTPAVALWVQCGLSLVAVWTQRSFANLASGFTFTMWIFYGLAGVALLSIRSGDARDAEEGREEFRCPWYPVVPVLFVLSAVAMTALQIAGKPWQTLPWFGVLLAGVPMYYVWTAVTGKRRPSAERVAE